MTPRRESSIPMTIIRRPYVQDHLPATRPSCVFGRKAETDAQKSEYDAAVFGTGAGRIRLSQGVPAAQLNPLLTNRDMADSINVISFGEVSVGKGTLVKNQYVLRHRLMTHHEVKGGQQ